MNNVKLFMPSLVLLIWAVIRAGSAGEQEVLGAVGLVALAVALAISEHERIRRMRG
jgi:hypothetical protein